MARNNQSNKNEIDKINSYLTLVRKAITQLRRSKKKITISSISKRSGISRSTFYNNRELKQLCEQAMYIQGQDSDVVLPEKNNEKESLTSKQLVERKFLKLKEQLEKEKDKNNKLLANNKNLVLEKEQLNSKISMLEKKVDRLMEDKVKRLK